MDFVYIVIFESMRPNQDQGSTPKCLAKIGKIWHGTRVVHVWRHRCKKLGGSLVGLLDDFMKCKYLYLTYLHMVLGIFSLRSVLVEGRGRCIGV